VRGLLMTRPELVAMLESVRHTLTCTDRLRCTDLTVEAFDAHLTNGTPRDRLEYFTDYAVELEKLDAAIAYFSEPSCLVCRDTDGGCNGCGNK
jgi:hypothetical protein